MRGTWAQRQCWENEDFDIGQQGKKAIYSRGTKEQVAPHLRWCRDCLNN